MKKSQSTKTTDQAADEMTELVQQNQELLDDLQRTRADFENYRKQMDLQKEQIMQNTKQVTILGFLPLLDDIDRGIAANPELAPLQKTLTKTIGELGLTKMDTAPGTGFNPGLHEAVAVEEDAGGEEEVITETLRPGYFYDGEILRPAMVKVKR